MARVARTACVAIVATAIAATSSLVHAAGPMPAEPVSRSTVVKINDHNGQHHSGQHHNGQHKNQNKGSNSWKQNRPQTSYRRPNKPNNDAVAIGVGIAAIVGALALSQQSQADDGRRRECRRLRWKCREGRGWACRKFEDQCT